MGARDPEAVAKNYQIDALRDDIASIARSVQAIDNKIDEKLVTRELMTTSIQLVRKDYDPMKKNLTKLTWMVIGVVTPLAIAQAVSLVKNLGNL